MQSSGKYSFKNLELWKTAQDFAVETARLVDSLPNQRSADVVGRQLLRSATSVAANIAEGHGRFTFGAYRNHLSIAKGSAAESQGWIDMLVRLGYLQDEQGQILDGRCNGLIAALPRRINTLTQQEEKARSVPRLSENGPEYELPEVKVPRFPGSMVPGLDEEEAAR